MKTLEQVLEHFQSKCIDRRDAKRLVEYIEEKDLIRLGLELRSENKGTHKVTKTFNRETILKDLQSDVEKGIDLVLNWSGNTIFLQTEVVRMWNNILENGLEKSEKDGYDLFKETADYYGWIIAYPPKKQ